MLRTLTWIGQKTCPLYIVVALWPYTVINVIVNLCWVLNNIQSSFPYDFHGFFPVTAVIHLFDKYLSGVCTVSDTELGTKHGPHSDVGSHTSNRQSQCSAL